jgi:4-hydroxy-3-methylbut-2-enyl diphosphate reductase IspH
LVTRNWLPAGIVNIGLTAGASTPNSIVGAVIERLEAVSTPA